MSKAEAHKPLTPGACDDSHVRDARDGVVHPASLSDLRL